MPQSKSPRKLGDISHLFLSKSVSEPRPDRHRPEAVVWLSAFGRSVNRAHLAAGLAAAVSRQGIFVSLLEVCRGLPTIGYYFGMEPIDYLAPSLERTRLLGGLWNGVVRFCFSADPRSFGRWQPDAAPPVLPHALLAAFSYPEGSRGETLLSELRSAVVPFVESAGAGAPDALILAGAGPRAVGDERLVGLMRTLFPETLIVRAWRGPGASLDNIDERIELPAGLESSWARRVPPVDPFFDDCASNLFQILSQRRRRAVHDAAIG
jgi:hypothetical protein